MLELTQMSRRHCTSEATGTLVPLLHVVRTETDAERLIPMNPELTGSTGLCLDVSSDRWVCVRGS